MANRTLWTRFISRMKFRGNCAAVVRVHSKIYIRIFFWLNLWAGFPFELFLIWWTTSVESDRMEGVSVLCQERLSLIYLFRNSSSVRNLTDRHHHKECKRQITGYRQDNKCHFSKKENHTVPFVCGDLLQGLLRLTIRFSDEPHEWHLLRSFFFRWPTEGGRSFFRLIFSLLTVKLWTFFTAEWFSSFHMSLLLWNLFQPSWHFFNQLQHFVFCDMALWFQSVMV